MTYKLDLNALLEMSPEQHEAVAGLLDRIHKDLTKDEDTNVDLILGLEFVCATLGLPGYEYS